MKEQEYTNNIVPESDYQAVVKAIESTFAEEFFNLQKQQQQNNDVDDNNSDLDHEKINEIYQACKESMLKNLERIVIPLADNEFHDYVDPFHIIMENDDEEDELETTIEESLIDEVEEEELDEEELIDQKAWKNAQELRTRIRDMSSKIQSIRERILKQSEEDATSSIVPHLTDLPVQLSPQEEEESDHRITTASLQESLESLSKILHDPQWTQLPNRIESLQDTIEAIQNGTSEEKPLSQTEAAILSTDNENNKTFVESSRKLLEDDSVVIDEDENAAFSPMDRLAIFGQIY
jgi:hypothetical protein